MHVLSAHPRLQNRTQGGGDDDALSPPLAVGAVVRRQRAAAQVQRRRASQPLGQPGRTVSQSAGGQRPVAREPLLSAHSPHNLERISPPKTYNYYKLPFCHPDLGLEAKKKSLTIGETLEGHDLTNSGYEIHFARALSPRASRELCPSHARNITAQRTCKPPRAAP